MSQLSRPAHGDQGDDRTARRWMGQDTRIDDRAVDGGILPKGGHHGEAVIGRREAPHPFDVLARGSCPISGRSSLLF
jgi:hypothetical protein